MGKSKVNTNKNKITENKCTMEGKVEEGIVAQPTNARSEENKIREQRMR